MSRGTDEPPLHRARHRASRPDEVGTALRRALVVTILPIVPLGLIALVSHLVAPKWTRDIALDPNRLLGLVVALAVIWALWMSLIWRVYSANRSLTAPRSVRVGGTVGILLMCAAITAPMAVGAQYAMVQRGVLLKVFSHNKGATTPKDVTAANPWAGRSRVNVLLLGGDGDVHRPGVRTDSVILASIDTNTGKAVLFSLPRNLQNVPFQPGSKLAELYPNGFTDGTANNAEFFLNAVYRNVPAAYPGVLGKSDNEGADAVKLAVSGALGIPVDYYVLVNLDGFARLVDAMGGITVNINERIPVGGDTDRHIPPRTYLEPGPDQRLNGHDALWFTRGRYGSTDYKRMERQRCAINAIAKEASPVAMFKHYKELAATSKQIVRTDIPAALLPAFVDLAGKVKGKPIKAVGFERSSKFDPNSPDFNYVHAAVQTALNPVKKPSGGSTAPSGGKTNTLGTNPAKVSDTSSDCAYNPVS